MQIGLKEKELTGELQSPPNKDALVMVVGEDHCGRVRGRGGVRLGKKKGLGGTKTNPPNSTSSMAPDMQKAVQDIVDSRLKMLKPLAERLGFPSVEAMFECENPLDKSSNPVNNATEMPEPSLPNVEVI